MYVFEINAGPARRSYYILYCIMFLGKREQAAKKWDRLKTTDRRVTKIDCNVHTQYFNWADLSVACIADRFGARF
jgi:hypothetical protein